MKPLAALGEDEARGLRGVLFDLDDTLLTHGLLVRAAYDALWDLHDAGLSLVAVTGRPSGWGEVLARQWPVDGRRHRERRHPRRARGPRRGPPRRAATTPSAAAAASSSRSWSSACARPVPEARLTDDVGARLSDVTWDVGERVTLPAGSHRRDRARASTTAGARRTQSSVHLHATFDTDDKASGALRFLRRELGRGPGARRSSRFAFVGDSGNDAACFAAFRTTFGVANVAASVGRLSVPPRYVARGEMGEGFAEMAGAILRAPGRAEGRDPAEGSSTCVLRRSVSDDSRAVLALPRATNAELVDLARKRLYANYKPAPFVIARGKGCELFDPDDERWLDLCAGVAVCSVGHAHPALARVMAEQAASVSTRRTTSTTSRTSCSPTSSRDARAWTRAFFCNSGTEANEALLKLARHHFLLRARRIGCASSRSTTRSTAERSARSR